jgi:hypothetical protein
MINAKSDLMKILVIGTKNTDLSLIEESKKLFDSVLFIPLSKLSVVSKGKEMIVKYKDKDISKFDAVFVTVPKQRYKFIHTILKNLSEEMFKTQGVDSFLVASNRQILFQVLAKAGIRVPKICLSDTPEGAKRALEYMRFPILVRPEGEEEFMLSYTEQEARTMIDTLHTLRQQIFLEEHFPKVEMIDLYVLGNEVIVGVKKKKVGSEYKPSKDLVKLNKRMISTALDVTELLKTEWAKITILNLKEPMVIDVNLTPSIGEIIELTGINPAHDLFTKIVNLTKIEKKGSWSVKFLAEAVSAFKEWKRS